MSKSLSSTRSSTSSSSRLRRIPPLGFSEIQVVTNNFHQSNIIQRGETAITYKGVHNGQTVAVKRFYKESNVVEDFRNEIDMLTKYKNDKYLVSLIAKCEESHEMIIVHEFMLNGTLADHLSNKDSTLSWKQLVKICLDVAQALEFLHSHTANSTRIIHRNLNPANIWLDENWAAKISGFRHAKIGPANATHSTVSTDVKGSSSHLDPYYNMTGKLTRRTDTYAFGVVMFEVLCWRPAFDEQVEQEQQMLAKWAQICFKNGTLNNIVDTRLRSLASQEILMEFAQVANKCLFDEPKDRPKMSEVVEKLNSILKKSQQTRRSTRILSTTGHGNDTPSSRSNGQRQ